MAHLAATVVLLLMAPLHAALAQGPGGGAQGSSAPPAASGPLKRISDRNDPLDFLLNRKKLLELSKVLEDSLKEYRKEMRRMQDVVYKDLDKAAARKENGQPLSATSVFSLTKESEERVRDIQAAYRDRARALLNQRQQVQVDSLEAIWKRDVPPR